MDLEKEINKERRLVNASHLALQSDYFMESLQNDT